MNTIRNIVLFLVVAACVRETDKMSFGTAPPGDEVCDDGADNDRDGLVDCEDSDCMDIMACAYAGATINVRVTDGGSLNFEREFIREGWTSWIDIQVSDVQGSVRIYGLDGTSTCDWSMGSATGAMSWEPYVVRTEIVGDLEWTREGFTIDSACALSDEGLFPNVFIQDQSFTTADGAPWYHGAVTGYNLDSTSYFAATAGARVVGWALEKWQIDPLETGESWSFSLD
jgi:hypothetical protein